MGLCSTIRFLNFKFGQHHLSFALTTGKVFRQKFDQADGDAYHIGEVELVLTPTVKEFMSKAGYFTPVGGSGGAYEWGASRANGPMIPSGQVVELTHLMDSAGQLKWKVPPGKWTVLRVGQTASGMEAQQPPTDIAALECDKLSKPAVKRHYDCYVGRLAKLCGPLAGKTFTFTTFDSFEVGPQNWTAGLEKEFRRRRGYALMPFLPLDETELQALMPETRAKFEAKVVIRKAVYGVLDDPARPLDVTARVQALLVGESLSLLLPVMDMAKPEDPAFGVVKTLRVEYTANGESLVATGTDGQTLLLEASGQISHLMDWRLATDAKGVPRLKTDMTGKFTATTANGKTWQIEAPVLPVPIAVSGTWKVDFQPGRGAPATAEFPRLISWSDHDDQGIRYFSGHTTYRNQITLPPDLLGANRRLLLNLGGVEVIAAVKINGKDCGILWHAPMRWRSPRHCRRP